MKKIDTCLSCHKPISDPGPLDGYHPACSRKLFGTPKPPKISFSTPDICVEAQKMVGRMSISGVQPKLSVIHERKKRLLTVVDTGGTYILKPQTDRFISLPENENLCMCIAAIYGIDVPSHGLLPLMDGRLAYVVKRFDRLKDGSKLQQEDFQQLLQTDDKYSGSYEKIANLIKRYSDTPGLDLVNLFERALLFFVLGNGDAHLKNFSLIKDEPAGYHISPAYDIVNSRLAMPDEREEMCLSIQGKKVAQPARAKELGSVPSDSAPGRLSPGTDPGGPKGTAEAHPKAGGAIRAGCQRNFPYPPILDPPSHR